VIVKSGKGYQVKSASGDKNLSKPGMSKEAAEKRIRQVEAFKAMDQAAKRKAGK